MQKALFSWTNQAAYTSGVNSEWTYSTRHTKYYLFASIQNVKKNDGETMNQLKNAIAVAVSYFAQWFWAHSLKSFPMRTVIPADAQAAAKVNVAVTPSPTTKRLTTREFRRLRFTSNAYPSISASDKLHKHCKTVAATR